MTEATEPGIGRQACSASLKTATTAIDPAARVARDPEARLARATLRSTRQTRSFARPGNAVGVQIAAGGAVSLLWHPHRPDVLGLRPCGRAGAGGAQLAQTEKDER